MSTSVGPAGSGFQAAMQAGQRLARTHREAQAWAEALRRLSADMARLLEAAKAMTSCR